MQLIILHFDYNKHLFLFGDLIFQAGLLHILAILSSKVLLFERKVTTGYYYKKNLVFYHFIVS